MAWHEGKPEYRSSPNSKEIRENFAYLKALADLVVKADLEKLHDITSSATEINQLRGSGVVKADLVKLHGITLSYAQINALINNVPPVGSIIAYVPGYFQKGNVGFTHQMVSANTVAAVNALLNPSGWYVCNGAALNDADSGIFNGASRYLPNLTSDRFLMGDTVAGVTGGVHINNIAHTHTTGNFTLTTSHIPSHSHTIAVDSGGSHVHNIRVIEVSGGGDLYPLLATGATVLMGTTLGGAHTHTATALSTGGGAAHNHGNTGSAGSSSLENRPPYLSCFYIMRVK